MTVTQLSPVAASQSVGARPRTSPLHDARRLWGPAGVELTVVIPFLNPGAALRRTALEVIDCLTATGITFEIVAVCDGSTDGSADTIRDLPQVRVFRNGRNEGKGASLCRCFAAAAGAWVGFVYADGDIDPRHLVEYLQHARDGGLAGVY